MYRIFEMMTKNIILYTLLIIICFSCQKDKICDFEKLVTRLDYTVDYSTVAKETDIDRILETHPHLGVQSIINDQYVAGVHCNLYFNDIRIITEKYSLLVGRKHPSRTELGSKILPDISIDLIPMVSKEDALTKAKSSQTKLNNRCSSIELAIFDQNHYESTSEKDFRLVWVVRAVDGGYPMVRIDAKSGEVLFSHDGVSQ